MVGVEGPGDLGAEVPRGAHVHVHSVFGPHAFGFAPTMRETLARLMPEIIDVQGLWTYSSLANLRHHRCHGTPYIITPHGMLDPWARSRSWWKKKTVRLWFEDAHLAGANCLRATAEMEATHFRTFGLRNPIAVVPNGVEIPSRSAGERDKGSVRRLLFLSRLHPKKGLRFLLNAWVSIASKRPEWELLIAGPDEVNHKAEMQRLAVRLGAPRVHWIDSVHGEEKSDLYRSADLFVLPTYAENFGLVIAEALAYGVPVITTRNAPWEGIKQHRCGQWIELTNEALREALLKMTAIPRPTLIEMGQRGRAWMERDFGWDSIAERMLEVYDWVLHGGHAPDCVHFS